MLGASLIDRRALFNMCVLNSGVDWAFRSYYSILFEGRRKRALFGIYLPTGSWIHVVFSSPLYSTAFLSVAVRSW